MVPATIQVLQKEMGNEAKQVTLVHPSGYDFTSQSINIPPRKRAKYKNCKQQD